MKIGSRRVWVVIALLGCLLFGGPACEKEELKQQERQAISVLLKTGTTFQEDAYVRAETLRVLEMLADASLNKYALACLEDKSPMVGVAAIRVLLVTKHPDVKRSLFRRWNQAQAGERRALFEAVRELGDKTLLVELSQKAMRSKQSDLRFQAFLVGVIGPIEDAKTNKKEDALRRTLLPELGKYLKNSEIRIIAKTLKTYGDFGQKDRAKPFLETLKKDTAPVDDRVRAGIILRRAHVQEARAVFQSLIEQHKRPVNVKKLGLPGRELDAKLVRASYLGLVALGDESVIPKAQEYLTKASVEEFIEVLEALAKNQSKEVTVSLKIAMQDAREPVRHRAIDLYGQRKDASAKALINALRQDDFLSKRKIASILVKRFPEEWSKELKFQLQAETKDIALKLMRDVIVEQGDTRVLEPLKEILVKLLQEKGERAATAAYLLLLNDPKNKTYLKNIEDTKDVHTRYVFLEHLVRHQPNSSVKVFRRYFTDDLYALRLLSAAGLLRAFKNKATGTPAAEKST